MKKSSILSTILLVIFCALIARHVLTFASFPASFTPNWWTIVPVLAIWAVFIGLIVRKEMAAAKPRLSTADADLAMACAARATEETA